MFFIQSAAKGHIRAKQNVLPPQVQILIHYLIHSAPLQIWGNVPILKLNESGRQKLGRYRSPPVQFSSVQDGISALGKAHVRSTASLRRFPSVALETVPMLI